MDRLWQDIRVSFRGLWKDRAFTLTAVATLALCLAANVAIFAVVGFMATFEPTDLPVMPWRIGYALLAAGALVAAAWFLRPRRGRK